MSPMIPQGGGSDGASALEHLRIALEHSQAALVNEPDDADSQELADIVRKLYAILANRQKEADTSMGGNPQVLRGMRRAIG